MLADAGEWAKAYGAAMPFVADDRGPENPPSTKDVLRTLGDLEEIQAARQLPAMVVGLLLALPLFIAIAVVLAVVIYGAYAAFHPTGAIASALGLIWFGGSLALTGIAVRPLLRRLNAFLNGKGWPTLY
jgi:hypothetical protein